MKIVQLRNLTTEEKAEICESQPVFLVGSAISLFPPVQLPTGRDLTNKISDHLFGPFKGQCHDAFSCIKESPDDRWPLIPFEALMECYPQKRKKQLPDLISRLFRKTQSNALHKSLVDRLATGHISGIITTNYDLGFDTAAKGCERIAVIRREKDLRDFLRSPDNALCFKIHGTAEEGFQDTLVFNLGKEGLLEKWKRELLNIMLRDKTLIVVGYAGRDFEICPELSRLSLKKVIWLHYRDGLTAGDLKDTIEKEIGYNASVLLNKHRGHVLIGDIVNLLRLFDSSLKAVNKPINESFDLQELFDCNLTNEWRMRVLERLSFPKLGLSLAASIQDSSVTSSLPNLLGNSGKYKRAAQLSKELSMKSATTHEQKANYLICAAGHWLSYGSIFQYWRCLRLAKKQLFCGYQEMRTERVTNISTTTIRGKRGSIGRMKLSWYTRAVLLAQLLIRKRVPPARQIDRALKYLQCKSQRISRKAMTRLEHSGTWDDIQIVQYNAEVIGIHSGGRLPPPSEVGLRNLALFFHSAIRERTEMQKLADMQADDIVKLKHLIRTAEAFGWSNEAWKNIWLLLSKVPTERNLELLKSWYRHFTRTEYSLLFRMAQLIRLTVH